ncbi:methyltransferase [Amycolatopsis albispora]|uniref:Methyltransferase n=1 Tax=Amycolatopsis albispora TaxID=1804986 RepID=A0A344L012_9PSEU|nr:methyltransferase [Amycolatopsis albispora]AXB41386.1 methyltransferase [Amycolatopsis albispora]
MTDLSKARGTLMRRLFGSRATEVVALMARMDLADAIGDGVADAEVLARSYDLAPDRLHRLLRALTSLGMCAESAPGKFTLTEAGALLRQDHPESMYDFARFHTAPETLRPWTSLERSLYTGRAAFEEHFGQPLYDHLADHPELSARFAAAMSEESRTTAETIAEHYDFGPFRTVTDIGGGDGTLITAILRRNPGLHGTVFDTAEGVAQAADRVRAAGLGDRCVITTGDFFTAVPAGSDLYLIKSTLHNWDDEHAVRILRSCRAALGEHGRLLIIDVLLPERVGPDPAGLNPYIKDLQMLVLVGGQERTLADFDRLTAAAGLAIGSVVALPAHVGLSLIEARPA